MAFQKLQVGGGAANIGTAYGNTNQLFGTNVFKAPTPLQGSTAPQGQLPGGQTYQADVTGKQWILPSQNQGNLMDDPYARMRRDTASGFASGLGNPEMQRRAGLGTEWTSAAYYSGGNRPPPSHYKLDQQSGYYYNPTGVAATSATSPTAATQEDWKAKLVSEAKADQTPALGPMHPSATDLSYIQLANMLDAGTYGQRGMSEQDVVNAMNIIKRSA